MLNNNGLSLFDARREAKHPIVRLSLPFVACLLIAACDSDGDEVVPSANSSTGEALALSAYRFRTDAGIGLNEDSWGGAANTPVEVRVDKPFRLRVELENRKSAVSSRSFSLQYRRNQGAWEQLTAEDFPYPTKDLTLDFSGGLDQEPANQLQLVRGNENALSWRENGKDSYLQLDSGGESLMVLGDYKTHWETEEFKAVLRLGKAARGGLLFGYQDVENHYRLDVEGAGPIALVQRRDGLDSILETFDVTVEAGRWIEVAVVLDGNEIAIEYEWDPIIEGMEWSRQLESKVQASDTGLYLPAQSLVDVKALELSAEAHSPRGSIVSSPAYKHGAETLDLLPYSQLPFVAGAGISFAPTTPTWTSASAQGEWEFPIVLRYFSDGAVTNHDGDRFEFRVLDDAGVPIASERQPSVTLKVPDGHLGGTFVETPGRLGPWQAADGELYFLMEPSETDNMMMMVHSADDGRSWQEVDGLNRPATGDLEGVASAFDGERIHILHQTSDDVLYHVFNTTANGEEGGWEIRDERLASPSEPPVQVADLALRSDGSVVGVYGDLHKIRYRVRSPAGEWGEAYVIDPDVDRDLSGPVVVKGRNDVIHLAYTGFDGTAWYRRILPEGELTAPQLVAEGLGTKVEDAGGILPLAYLSESDMVSIVYRLDNGELWQRLAGDKLSPAVRVTNRAVARNAADSEQVGADAVSFGEQIHVLFIEEGSGSLYHTWRDADVAWAEPKPVIEGEDVLWVRGAAVTKSEGDTVYGFVYDGGSGGGSGMNRYAEVPVAQPRPPSGM
ncbi:hypothetical protein DWB85_10580 [Seongchinamella sediminis]|uniref:Uncharacterized protein n=1 Tax=Seongchinamella sediminis TaxID=2283635 RepID=A0A3L7DVX4_9GAMM|nr:hypothetical protein DWB85_10580 [Seongchinamella sediminis]